MREIVKQGFYIIFKIDQKNAFLLFSKEIFESFLKTFPNNSSVVRGTPPLYHLVLSAVLFRG